MGSILQSFSCDYLAQNIDRGIVKASSLKAKALEAIRKTEIAKRRIKKISSSVNNAKSSKARNIMRVLLQLLVCYW